MATNPMMNQLAGMQAVPMQIQRPPTSAEQQKIDRVERMQVRTQAGAFATQLLQGRSPAPSEWTDLAKAIEGFIWEDTIGDAGPARLSPG